MSEAAHRTNDAARRVMEKYSDGGVTDEDDITGVLVGAMDEAMKGQIGGLTWDTTVVRHRRGKAAQERKVGADIIIHVAIDTPAQNYSKGVLVQAKRLQPDEKLNAAQLLELQDQCRRMLKITPAAFVFDYIKGSMRCGAATRIAGSSRRDLYSLCTWTSYRFFLELFRCPIGDPRITSARFERLPVPWKVKMRARGDLD